jgi:DNA-binding transcriptional MerR regulator
MDAYTVGAAAAATGWSARMLRYLERVRLVVPRRSRSGYRVYGLRELNQLRALRHLRDRFAVELTDIAFEARLRREPALRAAVDSWLTWSGAPASTSSDRAWIDWDQHKHERLLAA